MEKDVIKAPSFDDMIFKNRNKEYGAYSLRKKYYRTLLLAFISGIIILSVAVVTPYIRAVGMDIKQDTEEKEVVFVQMEKLDQPDEQEGTGEEVTPVEEEPVFFIVEEMPSFQGKGEDGFRQFIAKNLRYPEIAAENGISGRVYVQFAVNSKGQVVDAVELTANCT